MLHLTCQLVVDNMAIIASLLRGKDCVSSRYLTEKKLLLHWVQAKWFYLVWELLRLFRSPEWEKAFLQWMQANCFYLVWESMCVFRSPDCGKALVHRVQTNCFSAVWESLCLFRLLAIGTILLHWKQAKQFSLVCERLWLFSQPKKNFSHWVQAKFLSPVWDISCSLSSKHI